MNIVTRIFVLCRSALLLGFALSLAACAGYGLSPSAALKLAGSHEVPALTTAAMGEGDIMVAADHGVSGRINVSGMNPTMAHIHLGAVGKNGPVIVPLTKVSESTFVVPPASRLTDSQYESYLAGDLYVNVHSAAHPGGEIRAQLMPPKR